MATMYTPEELDGVLSFDSVIENDGQDFEPLPEGDYIFEVTNMERAQYNGGQKLPACPKLDLTFKFYSQDGNKSATVYESIMWHKSLEWKISAFFRAIGQKKHGEPLKPDLTKVIGSTGCAHINVDTYKNQNGDERKRNRIVRYYDKDSAPVSASITTGFQSIPNGQGEEIPFA